jgi:hypothetical protein
MLTAIALSAAAALLVVPLGHAGNTAVDDWFRDAKAPQSQPAPQPLDLRGDYMFQQYFRDAATSVPASLGPGERAYVDGITSLTPLQRAAAFGSHGAVLDALGLSAQDERYVRGIASLTPLEQAAALGGPGVVSGSTTGGTDWGEIGVGIALALGGALLLVALVAVGVEVRHSRHPLRNA